MNQFVNGVNNIRDSHTANGMEAFSTTLNPLVDLFFMIGASRGKDVSDPFWDAFVADEDKAIRTLLWARDCRGGAGERQTFRNLMDTLCHERPEVVEKLIPLVPVVGRWDDLLHFGDDELREHDIFPFIAEALEAGDGLCAKWMPRKGDNAVALREFMGLAPKQYRKLLVGLSNTVEQKMCAGEWDKIEFNHVPSVASARYQKAFTRNCGDRYGAYLNALEKGEAKINASAIFPHDVLKGTQRKAVQAQWDAIPFPANLNGVLPMVDVSGSMWAQISPNLSALDVSVAMGLFIATRQTGAFKDLVLTFSKNPQFHTLHGRDIIAKKANLERAHWGMNTNIEKAMGEILKVAVGNKVPAEDMPRTLIIFSDMEFDSCVTGSNHLFTNATAEFTRYGYELPNVVFWNLNARPGNCPVRQHQSGAALVSGYSPAVMKAIMEAGLESLTPTNVMLKAIMNNKYNWMDN